MRKNQKIINLYEDRSIRSIKHVVSIGSEEDLNQFWHYFDAEENSEHKLLYRFIGLLYAFVARLFEEDKELFFEIIIEQNDACFYFTIWNVNVSNALKKLLKKQKKDFAFKSNKKRITIKLIKEVLIRHNEICRDEQEIRRQKLISSVTQQSPVLVLPYTFMHKDDRDEVLKICDDMADLMYRCKKVGFQKDVFIRLRSCLSMFCLNTMPYPQISGVVNLITEFSVLMNTSQEAFIQMSLEEVSLVEGFVNNVDRWANILFVTGGADLYFMDNSLKADLSMIRMQIEPQQLDEEANLDDIFDF